jgi:hypothetical protein
VAASDFIAAAIVVVLFIKKSARASKGVGGREALIGEKARRGNGPVRIAFETT